MKIYEQKKKTSVCLLFTDFGLSKHVCEVKFAQKPVASNVNTTNDLNIYIYRIVWRRTRRNVTFEGKTLTNVQRRGDRGVPNELEVRVRTPELH